MTELNGAMFDHAFGSTVGALAQGVDPKSPLGTALQNRDLMGRTSHVSHNALSSGPDAETHKARSLDLDKDLANVNHILAENGGQPNREAAEAFEAARQRFVMQPADGLACVIKDIMAHEHFVPGKIAADGAGSGKGQPEDTSLHLKETGLHQVRAFSRVIDRMSAPNSPFFYAGGETRALTRQSSDWKDLINQAANVAKEGIMVAKKIGTAAAGAETGGLAEAGAGFSGAGISDADTNGIVDAIANIVNIATSKDHFEESLNISAFSIGHFDDQNEDPTRRLLWNAQYAFLYLKEDHHCGKTSHDVIFYMANVNFGFNTALYPKFAPSLTKGTITSYNAFINSLQSPLGPNKVAVDNPTFQKNVGRYNPEANHHPVAS